MKIKLSKSQWEEVGNKAGWNGFLVKKAQSSNISLSLDLYPEHKDVFRLQNGINGALLSDCDKFEIWQSLGKPSLVVSDYTKGGPPKVYKDQAALDFMRWN
jgi:hypothetical protein